jgi:hypothetical protein
MRSKEVEEAIKEGKDYIEFMTTAGDNAEWAETVLSYIEKLEKLPNKIRDKIKELKDREEELSDEQGYWGGQALLDRIEFLEELLGE